MQPPPPSTPTQTQTSHLPKPVFIASPGFRQRSHTASSTSSVCSQGSDSSCGDYPWLFQGGQGQGHARDPPATPARAPLQPTFDTQPSTPFGINNQQQQHSLNLAESPWLFSASKTQSSKQPSSKHFHAQTPARHRQTSASSLTASSNSIKSASKANPAPTHHHNHHHHQQPTLNFDFDDDDDFDASAADSPSKRRSTGHSAKKPKVMVPPPPPTPFQRRVSSHFAVTPNLPLSNWRDQKDSNGDADPFAAPTSTQNSNQNPFLAPNSASKSALPSPFRQSSAFPLHRPANTPSSFSSSSAFSHRSNLSTPNTPSSSATSSSSAFLFLQSDMASGFDDEEEEDEDELMTAKQPHEEDEEDSDYDPHRATPTADLVMAESSLHNASNAIHSKKSFSSLSDEAPPSTQSTSSQKTPTAQVAGNSAHHFALLNANLGGMVGAPEVGSFDPAYNHAHILDREGLERIRRDRYSYPAPPLHKIPQDYLTTHYKLQHRLGRGSFADVFKISTPPSTTTTTTTTPQPSYYALKKTRTQITGPKDRRFQLQELIIHMHLPTTSPHIISLHAAWEQYACLYMVLEYCPHGTLASYVERVGDVEEFVVWGVLGQLARGLEAVHAAGVVHMDLKPGNVLIGDGGVLKIGDFGCACFVGGVGGWGDGWVEREGDRTYIAPEVLALDGGLGRGVGAFCDVFSLGLIIFEISTNIILPENGSHWQKLRRHDFSECSKQLNRVSPPLVELIKGMLHPSPRERLGLDTVLGHPFVIAILEGPGGLFG